MAEKLLLVGVVGFASGIIARSFFVIPWPVIVLTVVLMGIVAGAYIMHRSRGYAYISLFLLLGLVGCIRVGLVPSGLPPPLESLVGTSVTLQSTVSADPDIRESTQRVRVRVEENGKKTQLLVVLERYPVLAYGDSVSVSGILTKPDAFATDGGRSFDYPHFLAKDEVFGIIERAQVEVHETAHPLRVTLMRALYAARHVFEKGVSQGIPEPESALALGLLTGGKQGLGKELLDAFTKSGLLPIVVLSGYNVMIVAEAVLRGFRFLPRKSAVVLAGITIFLFVLAAGAGSSAVRAGVMAGVGLFARATHRSYDALRALVFVFLIMILLNPLLLVYDPGFQFSIVATLGLVVGSPLVAARLAWISNSLVREVLATTIAAQLFVLPLLLYETGNLSLVAIPSNLFVLPVVPLAMLLSFVAGLAGLLVPLIAPVAGVPAFLVLSYVVGVAQTLANLPLASLTLSASPFVLVLIAYGFLAYVVVRMKRITPRPRDAA